MKRFFGGGLLVLLLAACASGGPDTKAADGFVFSVDPAAQTVHVALVGGVVEGAGPVGRQSGERVLKPGTELAVASSEFVFLPGNVLNLELTFKNASSCTFSNLVFSQGAASQGVVGSTEPKVGSAALGGDGKLAPRETTRALQFGVTHTGKPFTYVVEAAAVVSCSAGTGPQADLQVNLDARSGGNVAKGKPYEYYANVRNNGPDAAAGVSLVVTVPFPVSKVPDRCSQSGNTLTCSLGTIAVDKSDGVLVSGTASEVKTAKVAANVSATTSDPKASNNAATESFKVIEPAQTCTNPVTLRDATLEKAVRAKLKLPSGPLTCADMAKLTTLAADADVESEDDPEIVSSLEGLQFAVNLTKLSLIDNNISDLGPLSNLTRLTNLDLISNNISDLGPLSGLKNLTRLTLNFNGVSDLKPLSGLTNLADLQLAVNAVSDVNPLRGLTKLDILDLYFNKVSNISALVANNGLGNGEDFVDLSGNCLSASAVNDARTIEARSSNNVVKFNSQGGEQCAP